MRKFRAIVQSKLEPQDHEVIWQWKGKLLYWNNGWEPLHTLEAEEIAYEYEEAEGIKNVEQALNKLLYVTPEVTSFRLRQAGTYERGSSVTPLDFEWEYNKKLIREQALNGQKFPPTVRTYYNIEPINTDTTFNLWASDGTNEVTATTSIKFVDYIYYGASKSGEQTQRLKINPSTRDFTITAREGEYIWIFIPSTVELNRIWHNGVDATSDFQHIRTSFKTDTNLMVNGTMYISKNHSLNEVILKLT